LVQPEQFSLNGLSDLKLNEKRISVRARLGPFIKKLINDVSIRDKKEARLKIRHDLSIKCMEDA